MNSFFADSISAGLFKQINTHIGERFSCHHHTLDPDICSTAGNGLPAMGRCARYPGGGAESNCWYNITYITHIG